MAKIIFPSPGDNLFGTKIGTEIIHPASPPKDENPTPQLPIITGDLQDFIYVPEKGNEFYIAKNVSLLGKSWNQAIPEIYDGNGIFIGDKRAEMPTPWQYMTFVNYLLKNSNINNLSETERQKILDDMLKPGEFRGTWLNARFVDSNGVLMLEQRILDVHGNPATTTNQLLPYVEDGVYADITKFNAQGLLTTKSRKQDYEQDKNMWFWQPVKNRVAGAFVDSSRSSLYCDLDSNNSHAALGVRLVVRAKNLGGTN